MENLTPWLNVTGKGPAPPTLRVGTSEGVRHEGSKSPTCF